MKLLFDENLSSRLVTLLAESYPGSQQVETIGLRGQSDEQIWEHARGHDFIIVSKDNDFRQRSFLHGPPPKVIWLSVGNAGTEPIRKLLETNIPVIENFVANPAESLLVLELTGPEAP